MARGRFTAAAFDLPFSERVLDRAEGLIAHSRYVTERAPVMRPGLPVAHVPMGVPLPPLIERDEARARLGLPLDAFVLASFGHINPFKRVESVLRAVQVLRAEHAGMRYILVGSVSPNYDLRSLVARMGMENTVQITGYVERAAFEDYVAAADICVNLRHPTAGETSASLLRLLGAGRPTLVTASGSFTELPPGVAAQLDPDRTEGDLILAYCRLLARRPDIAAAMGAQARNYVAREHTLDGAAQGYMRFLSQLYGWGDTPKLREPLWIPTNDERRTTNEQGRQGDRETGRQSGAAGNNRQSADNLQSAIYNLQSNVAEALAGIGATENDHALLRSVAQALADLKGQQRD